METVQVRFWTAGGAAPLPTNPNVAVFRAAGEPFQPSLSTLTTPLVCVKWPFHICVTVWSLGNAHVTVQALIAAEPLVRTVTLAWNPVGQEPATTNDALHPGRSLGDGDDPRAGVDATPPAFRWPPSLPCSRWATKIDSVATIIAATAQPAARRSPPASRFAGPPEAPLAESGLAGSRLAGSPPLA
jgi:hypothetical protein